MKVHAQVADPSDQILLDALKGKSRRVRDNGLGFDLTRLGSQADETSIWVDPVIEVLQVAASKLASLMATDDLRIELAECLAEYGGEINVSEALLSHTTLLTAMSSGFKAHMQGRNLSGELALDLQADALTDSGKGSCPRPG